MKSLIKIAISILVIVVVVNIFRYAISVREEKLSTEIIKKKAAEKVMEASDRHKRITCPYCAGHGKLGEENSVKTCLICKGRGYGVIIRSGPDVFICPEPPAGCGGMGYVLKDGKVRRCKLCGGPGYGIKKH